MREGLPHTLWRLHLSYLPLPSPSELVSRSFSSGCSPPPSRVGRPAQCTCTQRSTGGGDPPSLLKAATWALTPKPCFRSRQGSKENTLVLDVLRCVMAGLFVYMALFELAPPHAHGRVQNLKYFCAFSFGLMSAYMADMFEDSMHSHQGVFMG